MKQLLLLFIFVTITFSTKAQDSPAYDGPYVVIENDTTLKICYVIASRI